MKKVALLPSLFTTGNLFCGIYAIILVLNDKISLSAWFILGAIFFDFLDGSIARLKNMATKFGMEYDSLADLTSFGLAPAIMVYLVELKNMGRMGAILFFIYIACTALRLARFNTQKVMLQKISFLGLPTPASSGFIASIFIFNQKYPSGILMQALPIIILILSALMVSTFRYPALGMFNLGRKKSFFNLVAVILCSTMIFLHLEIFLFFCFSGYILSGIVGWKWIAKALLINGLERGEYEVI